MKLLSFNEVENTFEKVMVIDELIMITQYDILWREDILNGWNFYNISQSLEFILEGYNIVVPKHIEPLGTSMM